MTPFPGLEMPPLPLLLWDTPPAVEQMLMQEGVPFRVVADAHPMAFAAGRFVLFDGKRVSSRRVRGSLTGGHVAIDVDVLRRESSGGDPFARLIDTNADRKSWTVGGAVLTERLARFDKAPLRRSLILRIRHTVTRAGGVWARLSPYPHPYRGAFNFRADLDESYPDDYFAFARAREPIDDCSTNFVSTHAYADQPAVLADLRRGDAQSHGHYHVVYRDEQANLRNLQRADRVLRDHGITCEGFAAPEGRWNEGLDRAIDSLGYHYSSDFHLGHDDLPFYPRRDGGFSPVLQVPIHPICEGLFLDAGRPDPGEIAAHLVRTIRAKAAAGDPAFVYGHPERRLGRFPEVVTAVARAAGEIDGLWRVTLTEFARWWRWRSQRRWTLLPKGEGRFSMQFDEWDTRHPLALEIFRGDHSATIPVVGPCQVVKPHELVYARRTLRVDAPQARAARPSRSLRAAMRAAIDWETVTPVDDLPARSVRDRIKKRLRAWRAPNPSRNGGDSWR